MSYSRPRTRTLVIAAIGVAIAAAALFSDPRDLFDDDTVAAAPAVRDTAIVQRSTLATDYDADGTVAYQADTTAYVLAPPGDETVSTVGAGRNATTQVTVTPASMVVTELVAEGSIVEQGALLWRLGNEPTVMLYGDTPAYRDLAEGDEGPDVFQLEAALVALGYDPDETVTVDEEFTARTEEMVERWQDDIGAAADGVVAHGAVVFAAGPSRVGDTDLTVGATALDGQAAFDLRTLDTEVTFTILPSERDSLHVGDVVSVRASGTTFDAAVSSSTVTDDGGATIVAIPSESVELSSDEVPATVDWSVELAADVVTVAAEAIVRTDDQRTWVERRDENGVETWVEVEIGRVSGGRVEVGAALDEGDLVIAP